jgi:acetyl-CoA decarbonylase/synthase complex subunit gamma
MALKGTELKNRLPEGGKKNCKECGLPTCFAFAMKVAKGEADIDLCPHLAPEVRAEVKEALTPPMALVTLGTGDQAIDIGQEEVMYRHEKSFLREPAIAILVSDKDSDAEIDAKIQQVQEAVFERAQVVLQPNLWALRFDSGDRDRFEKVVEKIHSSSPLSALIISEDLEALFMARDYYGDRCPLIYPITAQNVDAAIPKIRECPSAVGVRAEGVENLIPLTEKLKAQGIDKIVLDPSSQTFLESIEDQTIIRRCALTKGMRSLGYPTLALPGNFTKDKIEEILYAGAAIAKYAGVVVISSAARDLLYPLLIQRMDIYTDPRKLRSVEAKVYEFNEPGEDAPVLVSTNFALTFFTVSNETQASRVPSYLAVLDTSGFGVEPAMASGKFDGPTIAEYFKKTGLDHKVKTKHLILPWIARRIKHELREDLPDWEVLVGPKAINQLAAFLVQNASEWGLKTSG